MTDLAGLDPNAYIEPMELYDSIFWGKSLSSWYQHTLGMSRPKLTAGLHSESPDPWNSGVDSMSFDFLAHPAPGEPPPQQFYF